MESTIVDVLKEIEKKTVWNTKDLKPVLSKVPNINSNYDVLKRSRETDTIKKYDIIYVLTMTTVHYVMVHKVTGDEVFGVVISSKEAYHNIHKIEEDRYFKGNYFTKTYMTITLDEAKKNFVRVYENKKEADHVFRTVKEYYKKALNL